MINIIDKQKCTGCTACKQVCTKDAINIEFDHIGHSYPIVDTNKCVECGQCEKVCPMLHLDVIPHDDKLEDLPVYVVYNKDSLVRQRSTSGGIFTALSEHVIKEGGVVYGARFDEQYHIIHDSFSSLEEIEPFRGSKYAQSDLSDIFIRIKNDLKSRKVLFVGTPCQVAGLKSFLRKDYGNLYTCDFICMGISSSKHWDDYYREVWKAKRVNRVFFKDKRDGWHNWKMLIEYEGGDYIKSGSDDPFFYGYVKKLTMRPSCAKCPFRTCRRVSDFTIADAWGIDKVHPEFDDDKGCSTVILQNKKAEDFFSAIRDRLNVISYDIDDVKKYNPFIVSSITVHPERSLFERLYPKVGFVEAINKCKNKKTNVFVRFIRKIKNYYEKKHTGN